MTGSAWSTDFPTTAGAHRATAPGNNDAFLTKLASTGVTSWSTYLGGSASDSGYGVATNGTDVYVAGTTGSNNFDGYARSATDYQAFVTKFVASTGARTWSVYVGGTGSDEARDVALGSGGRPVLVGFTNGLFPVTSDAVQGTFGGVRDGFVAILETTGALTYATYFGGSEEDGTTRVATDSTGQIYFVGDTRSGISRASERCREPGRRGRTRCRSSRSSRPTARRS